MRRVVVKSGIKQLQLFKDKSYPYLEAHLGSNDDPEGLLDSPMQLVCIHLPESIEINGRREALNFCRAGDIKEASFKKLKELIDFSNKHGVRFIIIHLGFFDAANQDRYGIIDTLADEFNSLETGSVKLCIENVPCWTNLSFENEPVISNESHMLRFKQRSPGNGFVFDADHIAMDTVFQHFYGNFKKRKPPHEKRGGFNSQMEKEITDAAVSDPAYFESLIHRNIENFLSSIQPDLVHAAGSDFCNYRLIDDLPLAGEALPLGYRGKIAGVDVIDRIDHRRWLCSVPEDIFITIELYMRRDYDYLTEIRRSREFLDNLIC